jgi:hypothetical protein
MSRGAFRGIIVATACAAAFLSATSAAAAAQRYASPTGSGTACSSGSPCSLQTAFVQENPGDEIILASGDYGPIPVNLFVYANSYVHGVHGLPAPRIHFVSGHFIASGDTGARLSYLQLDGTSEPLEVDENTEADQINVHATAGNACLVYGTLIDSVCWTSSGDEAIDGASSAAFTPVLRNVTAEATGTGGVGIEYHTSSGGHITVTAVNLIVHGTDTDIVTQATLPDTAVVNTDHSNFLTMDPIGSGADITAAASQGQPPLFVNAAAGDFREAPGSPTIDSGVTSPLNGTFDFLGKPRTINGLTDIGADEFDPFAGVTLKNQKSKVKKRKAKVSIACPAGTPGSCAGSLTLTYGKKTAGSASFSVVAGAAQTLKVKISKKAFRKLGRKGKLATQATATAIDGAGTSGTATAKVKLKG